MEYLFKSILYVTYFLIRLYISGFVILRIYSSKKKTASISTISFMLLCVILGFSFYILLSYFFLCIWDFNLFSGFLIYPILNLTGLIYLFYLNFETAENWKEVSRKLKNDLNIIFLRVKSNLSIIIPIFFVFLGFSYYYHIKYNYIIWETISHPSIDPYVWQGQIIHLLTENNVDYNYNGAYPQGFVIIISGILLPFENKLNYIQIHLFCKNFPAILLLILIFALILIIWDINAKRSKLYIILIPFILLNQIFFMYRSFLFLPTPIISILSLILFYFIYRQAIPVIFHGFILGSMILIHPLYGIFYITIYLVYILIEIVINYKIAKGGTNESINLKKKSEIKFWIYLMREFKKKSSVFLIISIFILFFALNLTLVKGFSWISAYLHYFRNYIQYSGISSKVQSSLNLSSLFLNETLLNKTFFYTTISYAETAFSEYIFYTGRILGYFFILSLIWPFKKINQFKEMPRESDNLSIFLKLIIFCCFITYLIRDLNWVFISQFTSTEIYFIFGNRVLEIGSCASTFLFYFFLDDILEILNDRIKHVFLKSKKLLKKDNKRTLPISDASLKKLTSILLLLVVIGSFSLHYSTSPSITFTIPDSYNEEILKFREYQDRNEENLDIPPNLFYNTNFRKQEIMYESHFFWDHNLNPTDFNISSSEFHHFLQKNMSINDFVIITSKSNNFNDLFYNHENFTLISDLNYEIMILKKKQ